MTLDVHAVHAVLTVTPSPATLAAMPNWVRPRQHDPALRDGLSLAQYLINIAMWEARESGADDQLDEAVARTILTYGAAAHPGTAPFTANAAAGTTLFAARLAAETLRFACRAHPEARADATLSRLFDSALGQLFRNGRPLCPSGDPRPGLALLRHVKGLKYDHDVHPALEAFARAAACKGAVYQGHLRKLADAVARQHMRTERRTGQSSLLAQALTALVSATRAEDGLLQVSGPEPEAAEPSQETQAAAALSAPPGEGTGHAPNAEPQRPPRPERPDEIYLWRLCEHLADHAPSVPWQGRNWLQQARRWAQSPAQPGTGYLLDAPTMELYGVVEQADLPFPTPEELDAAGARCDNALAVVLAGYAVVRLRERGHSAGTGRSIGALLSGARQDSADHTLSLLMNQDPQGYCRLLRHLADAPGWIDLRTLAAVSYISADLGVVARLHANPTGHWPSAAASGAWEPIVHLTREYHATRDRRAT
jgi:hypothetical protein